MTKDLTTSFHFLCRDDLWKHEKPYSLKFIPKADFPKNNGQRAQKDGIIVEDIRGRESEFSFEKNGFAIMRLGESHMTYSDFDNSDIINAIYLKQIALGLQELLGARRVQIFDCLLRKSHQTFPIATGETYKYQQPANIVHMDATPEETRSQVQICNKDDAETLLSSRYQYVNVWKPLVGPVTHWPLAVCDRNSVDPGRDLERHDAVFERRVVETWEVYHSEGQKFYYLSDQTTDEALVMLQADSHTGPGVPHASFPNPLAKGEGIRESVEVRALVFY